MCLCQAAGLTVCFHVISSVNTCSSSNSKAQNMNIMLKDSSGVIKSPGYPSNYDMDLITQCLWKITAPKGQVVQVTFSNFRMGWVHCVDIRNSVHETDLLEISRCGRKRPFTVYSTGRDLSINVPNSYGIGSPSTGFIATYTFVPKGENNRVGIINPAQAACNAGVFFG